MKLLIEEMEEITRPDGLKSKRVKESSTETIADKNVTTARARMNQLKTANPNKKYRIHECHHDEPDETRTACKVLFES